MGSMMSCFLMVSVFLFAWMWSLCFGFYYIKVSGIASGNKLIKRYDILTCEDMISSHVKISMISVTSGLALKWYLNSMVYHRNIFGCSSKVFGNLRKFSEILGKCSGTFVWSLGQFWKNLRKSSENRQKRRYQYVYIIKRTLHVSSKI